MGAWAYHSWASWLPKGVALMPVELPGRNTRMREWLRMDLKELAREVVDALLPSFT